MTNIKTKAYLIALQKYVLIDVGILLLFISLPFLVNPDSNFEIIFKAVFFSAFITPAICHYEIKRSQQLPFYDNLSISLFFLYGTLGLLKIIVPFTFGIL